MDGVGFTIDVPHAHTRIGTLRRVENNGSSEERDG